MVRLETFDTPKNGKRARIWVLGFGFMNRKDTLFDQQIIEPGDFVFDERVVRVFPDMINRSVPGYGLIIPMIGLLAHHFAQAGSTIYDLGCSLGAASLAMRQAVGNENVKIVAVDNSPQMISSFRQLLAEQQDGVAIELVEEDIRETNINDASVVVLNFTLQFVDLADRLSLLRGIVAGLRPGGVLVLSEKICFEDPVEQGRQSGWHHDFKRAQGYSELEISRKRDSLEDVLKPETAADHIVRLRQAGFSETYQWYQGFSFASFVAIR
jgi:tRNA (cmo5U34)-methyltransferase